MFRMETPAGVTLENHVKKKLGTLVPCPGDLQEVMDHVDEETGQVGFVVALQELQRRGFPPCRRRRGICRRGGYRWLRQELARKIMGSHVEDKGVQEARAFLAQVDKEGVSVRERSRGMFAWAPWTAKCGQRFIKQMLYYRRHFDRILLFDVRKVWLAPGKKMRYNALRSLLTYTIAENDALSEASLFQRFMRIAEEEGALEEMRFAAVHAMVGILHARARWSTQPARLLHIMQVLELRREHLLTRSSAYHRLTLLHCQLPECLQEYCYPLLLPEDLHIRSTMGLSPAASWLQSIPKRGAEVDRCWLAAFQRLLDLRPPLGHEHGIYPLVFRARKAPYALEALLDAGAPVVGSDRRGRTALSSVSYLPAPLIRRIVGLGLDVNYCAPGGTPAIVSGHAVGYGAPRVSAEALECMAELGCDLDARGPLGKTALFHANAAEAETLLRAGADPDVKCSVGRNALLKFVSEHRFLGMPPAGLFTESNVSSFCANLGGYRFRPATALGWAVRTNCSRELIAALLDATPPALRTFERGSPGIPAGAVAPLLCVGSPPLPSSVCVLLDEGIRPPGDFPRAYLVDEFISARAIEELEQEIGRRVGRLTKRA